MSVDIQANADVNVDVEAEIDAPEVQIEVEAPQIEVEAEGEINPDADLEVGGSTKVTVKHNSGCNWYCCTRCCTTTIYTIGKILGWIFVVVLYILSLSMLSSGIVAACAVNGQVNINDLPEIVGKSVGGMAMAVIVPF